MLTMSQRKKNFAEVSRKFTYNVTEKKNFPKKISPHFCFRELVSSSSWGNMFTLKKIDFYSNYGCSMRELGPRQLHLRIKTKKLVTRTLNMTVVEYFSSKTGFRRENSHFANHHKHKNIQS